MPMPSKGFFCLFLVANKSSGSQVSGGPSRSMARAGSDMALCLVAAGQMSGLRWTADRTAARALAGGLPSFSGKGMEEDGRSGKSRWGQMEEGKIEGVDRERIDLLKFHHVSPTQ